MDDKEFSSALKRVYDSLENLSLAETREAVSALEDYLSYKYKLRRLEGERD